ncbi:tetratricopeptide repeat protein [Thalassotalea euphylliae]|uniref:tetratricopeptide repeat protein n=1 Tax=Thalassotalea euphylliae TaxID=1655234 RepID=UPI0036287D28
MSKRVLVVTSVLSVFFATALKAQVTPINIEKVCSTSPQACLENVEQQLSSVVPESRIWFQYKMFQLEALFQTVDFERLAIEVAPWIERNDIPLRFKINVLIYHAKILGGQGNAPLAVEYMNRAITAIEEVNSASYDPMLVVQIANGLNSLQQFQQGYELLLPLKEKYRNRHMPKFKHELMENLGHFAFRLGDFEEHLSYRLQALEWAKQTENLNQVAISTYNVARAHQMLKNYDRAFHYFQSAEDYQSMGKHDQNMIMYRRAEMSFDMGEIEGAKSYFSKVNRDVPLLSYRDLFDEFEVKLNQAK